MNRVLKITQAYSQTPWRRQLQMIGMFLALLVLGALIAVIYLNVTARAATIGREIQDMQAEIQDLEREIADKQSKLAQLTTSEVMKARAEDLGFIDIEFGETLTYVVVDGYSGRELADIAPPPLTAVEVQPVISDEYTQSLLDWARDQVYLPSLPKVSEQP